MFKAGAMQQGARRFLRPLAGLLPITFRFRPSIIYGAVGLSAATCLASASVPPGQGFATCAVAGGTSKKAIVFGGTSGIGLAASLQLRDRGYHVLAVSRSGVATAEGGQNLKGIEFASCDVTDRDALSRLFQKHGKTDVLISAATGGERALGPFMEMDMDAYQKSFAKLWGYANVVRIGGHYVNEGGSIVLVSGTPARRPKPGQVALASVGASVEQLVRSLAPELAARQVRINVVSPGLISTPMFGKAGERDSKLADAAKTHLIPRPGTPDEVAGGILFAVENTFVTGTTIDVDGGLLHRP
eukprot:TRINITY_DN28396_c0_g2_i1.p1 TRINITY_DN28396_c0_g2~~TRINITY_DN28396_c0_g2_i1.p1  ORF type:complete len:301 (-),score=27.37 TRINITY_DN28396_c0_g2_i1:199-1101(-)